MKKVLPLLLLMVSITNICKAQYYIDDAKWRDFLQNKFPTCFYLGQREVFPGNFEDAILLDTVESRKQTEDTLEFHGLTFNYTDGLYYFPSIKYFDCSNSHLVLTSLPPELEYLDCTATDNGSSSLPGLPLTLKTLKCGNNYLYSLPTLPAGLTYLDISNNSISGLNLGSTSLITLICPGQVYYSPYTHCLRNIASLPATLTYLDCSRNGLNSLPSLPDGLEYLLCNGQSVNTNPETSVPTLYSLPATLPVSLKVLDFNANPITVIPTLPAGLTSLNCDYTKVANIPELPSSMQYLSCAYLGLTALPALPGSMEGLNCGNNAITEIPALPAKLKELYCNDNLLISLPALPDSLWKLLCQHNQLASLPEFPSTLRDLRISYNKISCLPKLPDLGASDSMSIEIGQGTNLITCAPNDGNYFFYYISEFLPSIRKINVPLCNATNNKNHCTAFPVIEGTVYFDLNKNGIKDPEEMLKGNVKLELSNGITTYSNTNGEFQLGTTSLGSYTVTVVPPADYFIAVPASQTYTFSTLDTSVELSIALQATQDIDALSIKVEPLTWAARPGFEYPYIVKYQNTGTTVLTTNASLVFDNQLITYQSSPDPVTVNGNTISLNNITLYAGQEKIITVNFVIKPGAPLNSNLVAVGTITSGSLTVKDTSVVGIRGSYDPNDKHATPELTPDQVLQGKYIDYTVRFQNTGTDTAFTVVVADTLSSLLQAGTLQMMGTSHPCNITVKGNVIFFEFLAIKLPAKATNEPKSHGYIIFRIKPTIDAIAAGSVPNRVGIYFDYNKPVITNTASTLIKEPGTIPLQLISFNAFAQPNEKVALYWSTANEGNILSFAIEQSTDGRSFRNAAIIAAKGQANNHYMKTLDKAAASTLYYRLKINEQDGQYNYSPVVKVSGSKQAGIKIISNPNSNKLVIRTDRSLDNSNARIVNSIGIVVKNVVLREGEQVINTNELPSGFYYLSSGDGAVKFMIYK